MLKLELETQTRNKSGEGKALTGKYTHYGYYAAICFYFFKGGANLVSAIYIL